MVRHVAMDDIADVRLVDAEAESDGRHHHGIGVRDEKILPFVALLGRKPGVIGFCGMAGCSERLGRGLDHAARATIDNAAGAAPRCDQRDNLPDRVAFSQKHRKADRLAPERADH